MTESEISALKKVTEAIDAGSAIVIARGDEVVSPHIAWSTHPQEDTGLPTGKGVPLPGNG
ncbi:hypothetical protein ACIP5Y_17660 [Nocardia sp. NPDC088792]|uniref:hypothetical protein n=1 Tax=Nocardia sp. NPDC088792 TaxID=3364332 RepID=UPI00380A8244